MIEGCDTDSDKPREALDGIGIFLIGGCIASAGWFSATASVRALSNNVPYDIALFGILGLEAGVIASAYLFAWCFRRRFYWLLVYVLTVSAMLPLSYTGAKVWFYNSLQHRRLEQGPSIKSVTDTVYELRNGAPEDVIPFFLSSLAAVLPLVVFMGSCPQRRSLSHKIASSRLWMKELSNQIESTEGLVTWVGRNAKAFLFNSQPADPRVLDFQRQAQQLRDAVTSSLSALEVPDFLHETLMLRLIDMCGNAESTAFAAQRKLDKVGLLALNDCLDTVQLSDLSEETKDKLKQLLVGQFQHFHELSRSFTRANGSDVHLYGKETYTDVRSKTAVSTQA